MFVILVVTSVLVSTVLVSCRLFWPNNDGRLCCIGGGSGRPVRVA